MRVRLLVVAVALGLAACGESQLLLAQESAATGEVREALFNVRGVPTLLQYVERDGQAVYQGDILLGPAASSDEVQSVESALSSVPVAKLWPNQIIPYVIRGDVAQPKRVTDAMAHWHAKTAIRFVPRNNEADYLLVVPGTGCSSTIGHAGGEQKMTLDAPDACDFTVIIHELGHTVGLWHEQSRFDRDQFVTVLWDNIQPGQEHNFGFDGQPLGPYDTTSTMHYYSRAFGVNDAPTIVRKDNSEIPYPDQLSGSDIAGVAKLYDPRPTCTVIGSILAKYNEFNGANGFLGNCLTDELPASSNGGRYNHFTGGSIFWTPNTGAHVVWSNLRQKWARLGWERSWLGFPTSDPTNTSDKKAQYITFEKGSLVQVLGNGNTFGLRTELATQWLASFAALGVPTGDQREVAGGVQVDFERGSLRWDAQSLAVTRL
ncbi:MAG: M12 family metallopeptidase [Myxococcaceae bacterium]